MFHSSSPNSNTKNENNWRRFKGLKSGICKISCGLIVTHVARIYANLLEQKEAFTWEKS